MSSVRQRRAGPGPGAGPTASSRYAARPPRTRREEPGNFHDFVLKLGRIAVWPITYPLSLLSSLLTSPLTLSLLIRALLLLLLLSASAVFALIATATFWWSWGRAGVVEVDGWLTYGARGEGRPHAVIPLVPGGKGGGFGEDVKYDVEVEMELIRPESGEKGGARDNFMLTLEFLSDRTGNSLRTVSQPCLPASPYVSSYLPSLPSLNPISYLHRSPRSRTRSRSRSRARSLIQAHRDLPPSVDTQLLVRPMVAGEEGVVPRPGRHRGGERTIGSLRVLVGREDGRGGKEVGTTGWVVVRFTPRPTGIRWLLTAHPLPPLLILPPIALGLTISSALSAYLLLMCCFRSASASARTPSKRAEGAPRTPLPPAGPPPYQPLDEPQIALPPRARQTLEHDAAAPRVPIPLASPGGSSSSTSFEVVSPPHVGGSGGQTTSEAEEGNTSGTWSSAGEGEGEETPAE